MTRYPYHRYLRFLILDGSEAQDIRDHLGDELDYLAPTVQEIEELCAQIYTGRIVNGAWRERCDVQMFDEVSEDMNTCHWVVETGPVRQAAERLLLEGVSSRHTGNVLTLKFGRQVTEHAVSLFRRGFWDTETLTKVEFAEYFRRAGARKPDPPPTALKHRALYAAWEHGEMPDDGELSVDEMVRTIATDAFMQYNKARQMPIREAQDEARRWAQVVVRTAPLVAAGLGRGKNGDAGQPSLPGLRAEVYIPESNVPTIAELGPGAIDGSSPLAPASSSEDDLLDDDK